MINKTKIINDMINDSNTKETINNLNHEDNVINTLKNELQISEEQIKKIISQQNKEVLKVTNRLKNEIEKYQKFSLENLIIEFLPIIDNIERAFSLIKQKKDNLYIDILKNIEYVFSLINTMFIQFKISKIHDVNVLFNPNMHQAISVRSDNKIESNKILEVMQSGYIMHDTRLLRPAMVVVSKNEVDHA